MATRYRSPFRLVCQSFEHPVLRTRRLFRPVGEVLLAAPPLGIRAAAPRFVVKVDVAPPGLMVGCEHLVEFVFLSVLPVVRRLPHMLLRLSRGLALSISLNARAV